MAPQLSTEEQLAFARMLQGEFGHVEPRGTRKAMPRGQEGSFGKDSRPKISGNIPVRLPFDRLAARPPMGNISARPPIGNMSARPPIAGRTNAWNNPGGAKYDSAALAFMNTNIPHHSSNIEAKKAPPLIPTSTSTQLPRAGLEPASPPKKIENIQPENLQSHGLSNSAWSGNHTDKGAVENHTKRSTIGSTQVLRTSDSSSGQNPPPKDHQDILQVLLTSNPQLKAAFMTTKKEDGQVGWDDTSFMDDSDSEDRMDHLVIPGLTLLDYVGQVFPEIKALTPEQRARCECYKQARIRYFGLDNSKYNDAKSNPKDLRQKTIDKAFVAVREGVAEGTRLSARRLAAQLLCLEHVPDCPFRQTLEAGHPILFGASPAMAGDEADNGGELEIRLSHLRQSDVRLPPVSRHSDKTKKPTKTHFLQSSEDRLQPLSVVGGRGIMGGISASRWAS